MSLSLYICNTKSVFGMICGSTGKISFYGYSVLTLSDSSVFRLRLYHHATCFAWVWRALISWNLTKRTFKRLCKTHCHCWEVFLSLDSRPYAPCPQVACSTGTQEIRPSSGNLAHTAPCKVYWLDTGLSGVLSLWRRRSTALVQLLEHWGRWSAREKPPLGVNLLED